MKIISPKFDDCGKEIFRNELVRKHFVSDLLQIPIQQIHSVRLVNTFLRKRYRKQKLGILDILIELNDNTLINAELQLTSSKFWDKRQIFYLSKLYISELNMGDNYSKLKRCVCISILDYNFSDRKEYHSVYKLRDSSGNLFSDAIEIHILELQKTLTGKDPLDDWIRLFNAESEEDLDMIKTKNIGILEAIKEVKLYNLSHMLRARYEAHLKYVRDRHARDEYVRDEGLSEGLERGREQGIKILVETLLEEGNTKEQIISKLTQKFHLSEEAAVQKYNMYK